MTTREIYEIVEELGGRNRYVTMTEVYARAREKYPGDFVSKRCGHAMHRLRRQGLVSRIYIGGNEFAVTIKESYPEYTAYGEKNAGNLSYAPKIKQTV